MAGLPLRDGDGALRVTWLEVEIAKPDGKAACRNGFVTDLDVKPRNVAQVAACGRARRKIENETFNPLKTNGYNLEYNFGHGRESPAGVLATLNLPAFAAHTACGPIEAAWQRARQTLGARKRPFERLRKLSACMVFPSWNGLMNALVAGVPPPNASWTHTSSHLQRRLQNNLQPITGIAGPGVWGGYSAASAWPRSRSAARRSTETSCETPRSGMVMP